MVRRKARITQEQFEVIEDHVRPMLESMQNNLDALIKTKAQLDKAYFEGQRTFYAHSVSTLTWVIEVARQRMGANQNGGRQAV